MATQWYLKSGDTERGPVEFRELIELARSGGIARSDFVRSTWHKDWQTAAAVLRDYLPAEANNAQTPWKETVNAAMAASKSRQPRGQGSRPVSATENGGLFRGLGKGIVWLLAPLGWLAGLFGLSEKAFELFDGLWSWAADAALLRIGVRAGCALAGAFLAGVVIWDQSIQGMLRHLPLVYGAEAQAPGRYFPLIGRCSEGEYWILFAQAVLAAGVAAYFASAWLMSAEE